MTINGTAEDHIAATVLIVDDDPSTRILLSKLTRKIGHIALNAENLNVAMQTVTANQVDVVLLDVNLPDGSGLDILPKIRSLDSPPEVIIMTGAGELKGAEIAIKNGAWDYIQKSDSPQQIMLAFKRVLQFREERRKTQKCHVALRRDGLIGESPPFRDCIDLLAQASNCDTNVLVTGETGTGKELFAKAIHENSRRAGNNFVIVDCSAIPENLAESLLFGHIKGAFTGAHQNYSGLIESAAGGTLFLDEIGELPATTQKVFLRVLQERCFRPIGSKQEFKSDFRLIAATNQNLEEMVRNNLFRKDLLYRIRAMEIHLPPLRERLSDIRELSLYHTHRLCERRDIATKVCSPDIIEYLEKYSWPGNIRELVNTLDVAISAATFESILFATHLPPDIRIHVAQQALPEKSGPFQEQEDRFAGSDNMPTLKSARKAAADRAEKNYLRELLSITGDNVKDALRISGLSRSRYYELLKYHQLTGQSDI